MKMHMQLDNAHDNESASAITLLLVKRDAFQQFYFHIGLKVFKMNRTELQSASVLIGMSRFT